jgi:hypothetical protein
MFCNPEHQMILILIVGIIIVFWLTRSKKLITKKTTKKSKNHVDELGSLGSLSMFHDTLSIVEHDEELKPNLMELKYHPEYQNVLSGFKMLVSGSKRFNPSLLPATPSLPTDKEIRPHIINFIDQLQEVILTKIIKKGTCSLKLISSGEYQKFESEDEKQIDALIVLEKEGASVQIVLKVTFVFVKKDASDENMFWKGQSATKNDAHKRIDDINIIGFLSDDTGGEFKALEPETEHMDFKFSHGITDQNYVKETLKNHHIRRLKEMQEHSANIDEDGRVIPYPEYLDD